MIKKKLGIILENEEARLNQMETLLSRLPKGKLYTRTVHDRNYYSVYLNGKEKWITHDKELVKKFKEKELLKPQIISSTKACSLISFAINNIADYNYDDPILTKWSEEKYEGNPSRPEYLIFNTLKGHPVRSKSERFIADTLFMLKVPYRYEYPLNLNDRTIYPDFTILKPNGDLIIWEHFGLLDNAEYLQNCLKKLKLYKDNGFSQHRNLICTSENDMNDKSVIEDIIQRFYFS